MFKKKIALGLAMCMGLASVAGCSSPSGTETQAPAAQEETQAAQEGEEGGDAAQAADVSDRKVIRIAHANGTTWPGHVALEEMKEVLDSNPDCGVTIEILPNGVLGGENEVLQQVMLGTADGSLLTGMGFWQGIEERTAVDELPFFFQTKEEARNAYDGKFGDRLKEILDATGVKTINFWESGFRHFTNNIRPITVPEDMKGIKFRSYQGEYRMAMFDALGATAVPMALTEVFTALQQGTVDGQENPLAMIDANKFYEVQKYLSMSGHIYNTSTLIVNPTLWESLSAEDQQAFQEAAVVGSQECRRLMDEQEEEMLARFEEAGVEINEVDKDAFREALKPIYDKYIEACGDELIVLAQEYMEE